VAGRDEHNVGNDHGVEVSSDGCGGEVRAVGIFEPDEGRL
jgi:hypothetical protein